jgi:hypothetical protein
MPGDRSSVSTTLRRHAEAIRDDPSIYPTDEVFKRLTIDWSWSPEQMREIGRAWNRIKAGE